MNRYAPENPAVSDAVVQDAEGLRWGYGTMAAVLALVPVWALLLLS